MNWSIREKRITSYELTKLMAKSMESNKWFPLTL